VAEHKRDFERSAISETSTSAASSAMAGEWTSSWRWGGVPAGKGSSFLGRCALLLTEQPGPPASYTTSVDSNLAADPQARTRGGGIGKAPLAR